MIPSRNSHIIRALRESPHRSIVFRDATYHRSRRYSGLGYRLKAQDAIMLHTPLSVLHLLDSGHDQHGIRAEWPTFFPTNAFYSFYVGGREAISTRIIRNPGLDMFHELNQLVRIIYYRHALSVGSVIRSKSILSTCLLQLAVVHQHA